MDLILIICITNIVIIGIAFYMMMRIFNNLTNKLLQIEIVKKAKTFQEAKEFWTKDIAAEQKFEKKIVDEQEKAFATIQKKELTPEEKEEANWKNV